MFKSMTPDQRQAASLLTQPISVMASAGSGKTTTMVERYVNFLRTGFSPRQILTVTFTKEAAEQLRDRIIERIMEYGLDSQWIDGVLNSSSIGTLHSLCYSILNQFGTELGFSPITSIVDDFSLKSAFLKNYQDWLQRLSPSSLNKLLDHFSHRELKEMAYAIYRNRFLFYDCVQLATDAGARDSGASVIMLLGNELKSLNETLALSFHQRGQYSFDDLENLALKVLKESAIARTRLSEDYQKILIDEFQDTSPLQWQILTLLLGDDLNKLFIVGDPKQSIYGFRHAEPALFDEVTRLMSARGGQSIELVHNFRTHSSLLEKLNSISSTLFSEHALPWKPMVTGLSTSPASESTFSVQFFGPKEKSPRREVYQAEIDSVCLHIEHLLKQDVAPGTIAILFRNGDRIAEFSAAFSKREWGHRCQQTEPLTKQLSALEIVSFLRFLLDPTQDGCLITILRSHYVRWNYEQVLAFTQKRRKNEAGKYEPLVNVLRRDTPEELSWLVRLLDCGQTEVTQCLEALFFQTKCFPIDFEAFGALLKPLSEPGLNIFDIRLLLESFQESDYLFHRSSSSEEKGGIQLMTVHASKGLEFEHVILVDAARQLPQDSPSLLLKAGLPPGIRFWEQEEKNLSSSYQSLLEERRRKDAEESRRILYVALTRAQKTLTVFLPFESALSYPKNSWADLLTRAGAGDKASLPRPEVFELTTTTRN